MAERERAPVEMSKERGQATVVAVAVLVVAVVVIRAVAALGVAVAEAAAAQAAADAVALAAVVDEAAAGPVAAANDAVVERLASVPGRVQVTVVRRGRRATATAELTPVGLGAAPPAQPRTSSWEPGP